MKVQLGTEALLCSSLEVRLRSQELCNLSYGNYACETPQGGGAGWFILPGRGEEVPLKVWTVLGLESGGPFRK